MPSTDLIRFPIAKSERRDRQNLVFGWANVPHPAGTLGKALHTHLDEGQSLDEIIDDVRSSYLAQFPNDEDRSMWSWVMAVFSDHVIVEHHDETGSKFLRHNFIENTDGGGFVFGDGVDVERTFVAKALEEYHIARLAKAAEPKVDWEGDRVQLDALERAAYDFTMYSGRTDIEHDHVVHGQLVESVVITDEKLEAMGVPAGSRAHINKGWWLGFQVDDPTMDRVEAGDLTMFSVGGDALRVPAR